MILNEPEPEFANKIQSVLIFADFYRWLDKKFLRIANLLTDITKEESKRTNNIELCWRQIFW